MAKWTKLYITPVEGVEDQQDALDSGEKELVNKTWEGGVGKYMNKEAQGEKGLGGEYVGR